VRGGAVGEPGAQEGGLSIVAASVRRDAARQSLERLDEGGADGVRGPEEKVRVPPPDRANRRRESRSPSAAHGADIETEALVGAVLLGSPTDL
jgi:hypothetical protein